MFGRRQPEVPRAARAALYDPAFECRAPGVARMEVLYDLAIWLRCPSVGHDRTEWRDRAQAAYATDLGWSSADRNYAALGAALDRVADDELSHTATFVLIPPELDEPAAVAWVNVFDEELTLLEHDDPERYLGFLDLNPARPERIRKGPNGWRSSSKIGVDAGNPLLMMRGQRRINSTPLLYITGGGFAGRGKRSGDIAGVFYRTRLYDASGNRL